MSDYPTLQLPPATGGPPPTQPPHGHRRGLWLALIAGLAVLALAVPLALLARHGSGGPGGTRSAAPSAASSPYGSGPASTAATATAATATGVPAPDGRIPLAELKNATLDIPAWPADNLTGLSGLVAFHDGTAVTPPDAAFPFERYVEIYEARYGDVDRDGAQETVAAIGAHLQGGSEQLVAFDRDTSGRIVTLGTVVATTGAVRTFDTGYRVRADGVVEVRVADFARCCGDETPQQWQWRQYGWTGQGFRQVGGPSAFPVNPRVTETGLTAGTLVLGPAVDGVRHGTFALTVSYLYGAVPDHLTLGWYAPDGLRREGDAWPAVHSVTGTSFAVDLPTPAAGRPAGYTFGFTWPANAAPADLAVYLQGIDRQGVALSEANPYNSSVRGPLGAAG